MVTIQIDPIQLQDFPKIQQSLKVSPSAWSIPYCIGYGILKVVIRSKSVDGMHEGIKSKLSEILENCKTTFNTQDALTNIETFSKIFRHICEQTDPKQCHEWLEYWMRPEQSLNSILYTSYYMLSKLANQLNLTFEQVLQTQPLSIIQCFSKTFNIYVQIIWDSGSYVYETNSKEAGFVLNYYYYSEDTSLCYLKLHNEKQVEEERFNNSEFTELFLFNNSAKPLAIEPFTNANPQLLNLLSFMTKTLADNNLYSGELDEALNLAIKECPDLGKIPIIKTIFQSKKASCVLHPDAEFIKLNCKSAHCSTCIYQKIKEDYTKVNKALFCDCRLQISPKIIDEIKKSEGFKEYFRSF